MSVMNCLYAGDDYDDEEDLVMVNCYLFDCLCVEFYEGVLCCFNRD